MKYSGRAEKNAQLKILGGNLNGKIGSTIFFYLTLFSLTKIWPKNLTRFLALL